MNRRTGMAISSVAHIQQSIEDILTTPLGSRVMRREYGSQLPELIDAPLNALTVLRLYAATAMAVMRWEPRIRLSRLQSVLADDGSVVLEIQGSRADSGAALNLRVPLKMGAMT